MENEKNLRKSPFDGKRCIIKGDHPHVEETGVVMGADYAGSKFGLVVKSDETDEEFFVFDAKNLKWI